MTESTRYPTYDVWEQHGEWDEHTRQIVGNRRIAKPANQFFTPAETILLQNVVGLLVDEHRLEVLSFITEHLDTSLDKAIGESQRKVGVPPKGELYRQGLQGIDEASHALYQHGFLALQREQQLSVLHAISQGSAPQTPAWSAAPQRDFFKRLLEDAVSACYSHPLVWSDIGYGGPAYPRGYVRVEKGLVDPWEAKQNGS